MLIGNTGGLLGLGALSCWVETPYTFWIENVVGRHVSK